MILNTKNIYILQLVINIDKIRFIEEYIWGGEDDVKWYTGKNSIRYVYWVHL